MTQENETLLRYMSERLKQEPYISNPNSKLFLAEVATVIMHDIQEDGKYSLIIDDCFNNFKDRIFDFSLKQIYATRNFNYFRDKDDTSLSDVFHRMVDDFKRKEILALVLLFDNVESIDEDYKIIFKIKTHKIDDRTPGLKNPEEPFIINRLTSEDDIKQYFKNKIDDGYYTDIYKLLVDFTLMMYRRGAISIDLSLPSFNSTIAYINKLIKNFWIHTLPANELEPKFSYLWKTTKPFIINRAIDSLQIPYEINHDGSFIIPLKNDNPKIVEDNIATEEIKGDPVEDNEQTNNNEDANIFTKPHIYPDNVVESKLSTLFDVSETAIIEEDALLNEINSLLYSHAWENAYDLYGDIQYIIFRQKKISEITGVKNCYNNIKLTQFEGRHSFFLRTFPKQIKLDSRQNSRNSFKDIWYNNYAVSTIQKLGKLFEPVDSVDNLGNIKLKALYSTTTQGIENPTFIQKISFVCNYKDQLKIMYDNSDSFFIIESDIIFLHRRLIENGAWGNPSDCIASIAYILIRQIEYNKNVDKKYTHLINLYRKSIVIHSKYGLKFNNKNHEENLKTTLYYLLNQYDNKILISFYQSIFNLHDIEDNSAISTDKPPLEHISSSAIEDKVQNQIDDTEKTNQTNELLVDLYRDSEKFIINEQRIVNLHSQFVNSREWSNISQCIASIAYVLIRQIELANRPRGLKFKKLKNLYRKCIDIYKQDNLIFEDGNHLHNIGIVKESLIQRYKYLLTVFFKEIIGSYNVATDGTIIFEEEEQEENTSVQNDTEDDSNDNNNSDGNVEKEEDDKMPQEPTTDIPEFDSNASYNEEGTNILLAKIEAYSNNSSIVEIFQYYFLDIQESFFHVKTKGELFEAYQHFKEYTAINFISKTHKEELMEAFRCYIYYLLEINKK